MTLKNFLSAALCVFSLLTCTTLHALVVGSDTAVSRQSFITFPAADTDNTVLSFAALDQGFFLADQTTSFSFNSYFPVNLTMGLNGGVGKLAHDLYLDSFCDVVSSGSISGGFYTMFFEPQDGNILFPYAGNSTLFDQKNAGSIVMSVDWSPDDRYLLVGTQSLAGNELQIYYWNSVSHTLTLTAGFSYDTAYVEQLEWHPTATAPYYFAVASTDGLRTYSFDLAVGTIGAIDTEETGFTFWAVSWAPSGTYLAASKNNTAEDVAVYTVSAGVLNKVCGFNLVNNPALKALGWDPSGRYLAMGWDNSNSALTLFYYNSAALYLLQSFNVTTGVQTVAWSHDGALLAVGLRFGSTTGGFQMYGFDGTTLNLQSWTNIPETVSIYQISWDPSDSFFVYGRNNATYGLRAVVVDRATKRLVLAGQKNLIATTTVAVNHLANKNNLASYSIASGDASNNVSVWGMVDYPFTFSNTTVIFNNMVTLNQPLYFYGDCVLNAHGNHINLNDNSLVLLPGATLSIYDAVIYGLGGFSTIEFLDNTTTVSLHNVTVVTTGSYSLQGKWDIVGDVIITGTQIFTYATSRQSTIYSNARLAFDSGMTFSYYPSGSATNLLAMQDATAQLYLYETTSYLQSAGLVLTYGMLTIEGECPLYAGGGLHLDDGNPAHAVTLNVLPESGIKVISGSLYD